MTARAHRSALALLLSAASAACTSHPSHPGSDAGKGSRTGAPAYSELVLERALPLEVDRDFEPSALLVFDGHLLTISDKESDKVFELSLGDSTVAVRPFLTIANTRASAKLDFEGLALGPERSLLVASEAECRVLRVELDGRASWATPPLEPLGARAGLFRKHNAGIEGIAALPDGRWLLAAERDPRGLVEIPEDRDLKHARAQALPDSIYGVPKGRNADFADLTVADGQVYALERNLHLVVRLEARANGWIEREAYSYAKTENDAQFAYQNQIYGRGEGLAIDERHVFIVLDNNNDARARSPDDRRPLLFVFRRPAALTRD